MAMRTQSGFGLVEVLIALSISIVVMVGFTSFMSFMNSNQNVNQARQDQSILIDEVKLIFGSPTLCMNALPANFQYNATLADRVPPLDGQPITLRISTNSAGVAQTLESNLELDNYNLKCNKLQMYSNGSSVLDPLGNRIYPIRVMGQFSPKLKSAGLRDFQLRNMAFGFLQVNAAGIVVGCGPDSPAPSSAQLALACTRFGGSFNYQNNQCTLVATTALPTPTPAATATQPPSPVIPSLSGIIGMRCPGNQGILGFTASGTIICENGSTPISSGP